VLSFSLYQNGILIANSEQHPALTIIDVTLHAIATVAANETIDVRWNCDSGKIILKIES
jgi:hypothetical protein